MKIDSSIFKAYDIRGTFPDQLDAKAAYAIGRAFAVYISRESGKRRPEIAVGRDVRISSPKLFEALARGITDQGADVADIGETTTGAVYFVVGNYGYDGGVMVTASHNPKEYNGFKLIREGAVSLSGKSGIPEIRDLAITGEFPEPEEKGRIEKRKILEDFARHVVSFIEPEKTKGMKIIVDAGNGMAAKALPYILKFLPCEIVVMNGKPDGRFPSHNGKPNTLAPGYLDGLSRKVLEEKADFGAAFDGDADRMILVDEKGMVIGGDVVLAWMAKDILRTRKGAGIVYTVICSKSVPETIREHGGRPIRSMVGSAFIKQIMRKERAVFAGEASGHYYFRDNFYSDSGMIAFVVAIEALAKGRGRLSEELVSVSRYAKSKEINIKTKDREGLLARTEKELEKRYPDAKIDRLDGLTMEFGKWWFNARPSNTEPLLRLTVEAENDGLLEEKKKEILEIINS